MRGGIEGRAAALALVGTLVMGGALAGCGSPAEVGEPCDSTGDCLDGLSCFNRSGGAPVCMEGCDTATTNLCDDGSVCLGAETGGGVCYLGGTVALGAECTSNPQCVMGALCVNDGSLQACREACEPASDTCPTGFSCSALTGGGGFCAPD